jgi:hypothetical protein
MSATLYTDEEVRSMCMSNLWITFDEQHEMIVIDGLVDFDLDFVRLLCGGTVMPPVIARCAVQ